MPAMAARRLPAMTEHVLSTQIWSRSSPPVGAPLLALRRRPEAEPPLDRAAWQERVVGRIDGHWIMIRARFINRAPWPPPVRRRRRERKVHAPTKGGANA